MTNNDYKAAVDRLVSCFQTGHKLLVCGNGGSSADCAHIVGELAKGFILKRKLSEPLLAAIGEEWACQLQLGLPALDLTANGALLSAVANDLDAKNAYAQQVIAYGQKEDVLLGISTSGNAENVCRALKTAKAFGLSTIGLTGKGGGRMAALCDILLDVEETETYRVQEKHLPLYHQLCIDIEKVLF